MTKRADLDFMYWARFPALEAWQIASLQLGIDPRVLGNVTDEHGDALDLSEEMGILADAVLTGELIGYASSGALPHKGLKISAASLVPWLRKRGYVELADGLSNAEQQTPKFGREAAQQGASGISDAVVAANANEIKQRGLSTTEIAQAFDGVHGWSAERWPKNLSQSKWLVSSRLQMGARGGPPAMWCPLAIAKLLHGEHVDMKSLARRFRSTPILGPWRDEFEEYFATHCVDD